MSAFPTRPTRASAALDQLARRAAHEIGPVDAAGLTVLDGGGLVLGASSSLAREVDLVQYGYNQGPCLSAVADAAVTSSGSIGAGERRWPRFCAGIAFTGLASVLSFPLVGAEHVEGSVNLYSRTANAFGTATNAQAEDFVRLLADSLDLIRISVAAGAGTRSLGESLDDRATLTLAVGLVGAHFGLSPAEARRRIDDLARHQQRTSVTVARSVLDAHDAAIVQRTSGEDG